MQVLAEQNKSGILKSFQHGLWLLPKYSFTSSRSIRVSCVSLWRWFLSRVWVLCSHVPGYFPHVIELSCCAIMVSVTGICSSFCFPFISMYIHMALPEWKHICSIAFQNTQAVCLYKVVNLACPSWQMHLSASCVLVCIWLSSMKIAQPSSSNKGVSEVSLCLPEQMLDSGLTLSTKWARWLLSLFRA